MELPLRFVPIPLATGNVLPHPASGSNAPVRAVRVTATLADGTEVTVPLTARGTGWWAPQSDTR